MKDEIEVTVEKEEDGRRGSRGRQNRATNPGQAHIREASHWYR